MSFCGLGKPRPKTGRGIPLHNPKNSIDINGVVVSIEKGDITRGKGDAVVAGEDEELSGKGGAMTALIEAGGKKYKKKREELREHLEKQSGAGGPRQRVYKTKAGKLNYTFVLHAMTPGYHRHTKDKWYDAMKSLNKDVITEAEENGLKVLVMPVLGSGKAAGPVDISVQALLDAVKEYSPFEHIRHIVLMDTDENHVMCIRQEMERRRRGSLKYNTLSQSPSSEAAGHKGRRHISPDRSPGKNAHTAQENRDGGATWNGGERYRREKKQSRGGNSSVTKGSNSGYAARCPETNGYGFSHEAEDVGVSGHQDQVPDGKKKAGTIPRMRKPRSERVFYCDKSQPFNSDDFAHSQGTKAHAPEFTFPREASPSHSRERQQHSTQDVQPSAAQSGNSHTAVPRQSPRAEVPETRAAGTKEAAVLNGKMIHLVKPNSLAGYPDCGTIVIEYSFANGVQGHTDPRPGQPYKGIFKRAYLPDSTKGRELLLLLKVAFDLGLLFHIRAGERGSEDHVVLREIPHKTNFSGGMEREGYPDPGYLGRLEKALAREGITRGAQL